MLPLPGLSLDAPLTTWTDYILTIASLWCAFAVARSIGPHNRVTGPFWCGAFVAVAAAAASGGTYHGFATTFRASTLAVLWNVAVFAMGAAAALVGAGVHAAEIRRDDGTVKWLAIAIAVTAIGLAVQQRLITPMPNLDANAAYHLIQLVALYFLFRCAQTVRDRAANRTS